MDNLHLPTMSVVSDRTANGKRKQAEPTTAFSGVSLRQFLFLGSFLALLGMSFHLGGSGVLSSLRTDFLRAEPEVQLCPQAEALFPMRNRKIWEKMNDLLKSEAFEEEAVKCLAGSIRVAYASHTTTTQTSL